MPGTLSRVHIHGDRWEAHELPAHRGTLIDAGPGTLTISYAATVTLDLPPPEVFAVDRFEALLPSRYCPSDRMAGFALDRFGSLPAQDRPAAIRDYVHRHLSYVSGSSAATTDAVDTLLAGRGVCRDYAHLMVALCRAANVPARVVSVYAPGLSPMDFHLVAETAAAGTWQVWDATGLAPRQSLARIATGRDAADVAFSTILSGTATLESLTITATVDGDLPVDDHTTAMTLNHPDP